MNRREFLKVVGGVRLGGLSAVGLGAAGLRVPLPEQVADVLATYVVEAQGLRILFAGYTEGGETYLVLLQAPLGDCDTIYDAVLIPALENFEIG